MQTKVIPAKPHRESRCRSLNCRTRSETPIAITQTGATLAGVRAAYCRNENANNHSANIALLARHFGTPTELAHATEIVRERDRIGARPDSTKNVPDVYAFQMALHGRYIDRLFPGS